MTTGPEENAGGNLEQRIGEPSAVSNNGAQNGLPASAQDHVPAQQEEVSTASPVVFDDVPQHDNSASSGQIVVEDPSHTIENPIRDLGQSGLQSLFSVIVIALFVITFVVQAFQIPSQSMEKTLLIGDYLLVDKVHFGQSGPFQWLLPYRDIHRGDIVVFHYPVDPTQHFVKRVVGVPGDHIRIQNKRVYVNGMSAPEGYAVHSQSNLDLYRDNFPDETDYSSQVDRRWRSALHRYVNHGEVVVPPNEYFVMGDNRDESLDSRYWGFVPRKNIVGRPLVIYLSLRGSPKPRPYSGETPSFGSGSVLTHAWNFARWDRMFRLIR